MNDYTAQFKHYLTGITMLDQQHWGIVKRLYNFDSKSFETTSEAAEFINASLLQLKSHFNDEQQLMESLNFPGLNYHKVEHERLSRLMDGMLEKLTKYSLPSLSFNVNKLSSTFMAHIDQYDLQFAEWVKLNASS